MGGSKSKEGKKGASQETLWSELRGNIVKKTALALFSLLVTVTRGLLPLDYFDAYWKYLLLESIVIVLWIFTVLYVFGFVHLADRPRIKRGAQATLPSQRNRVWMRRAAYVLPLLVGLLYFFYFYTWEFTLNKFSRSEVGILVADFRETNLKDYLPQKKYANYIKEQIAEEFSVCTKAVPVRVHTTGAFFMSKDEAVSFLEKTNAKIVIWGEVLRSDKVVSMRPRVFAGTIGGKTEGGWQFGEVEQYQQQIEDWSLDGSPPTLSRLGELLNSFLVGPIVIQMKTADDTESYRRFLSCISRTRELPGWMTFGVNYELARLLGEEEKYDSAIIYLRKSLSALDDGTMQIWNRRYFKGLAAYSLSTAFAASARLDSATIWGKRALTYHDSFIERKDLVRFVYFENRDYRGAIEKLLPVWSRTKDTTFGDLIVVARKLAGISVKDAFFQDYSVLYPGRYERVFYMRGRTSGQK